MPAPQKEVNTMKGLGVLYVLLVASAICVVLAVYGHVAGWPVWGLVILWVLALPAVSALSGMIAGLLNTRR
jgi:membrane protein YdbS with pleckstrin-like domain